jgi:hypothetical protein
LDIKFFYKKDGGVVQLIGMEKIKEWNLELPFIFTEYIRSNKIKTYRDPKVEGEITKYLDEILNTLAIPKIKEVFEGSDLDNLQATLSLFEELSETNTGAVLPLKPLLENLTKNTYKTISAKARKILNNIKS